MEDERLEDARRGFEEALYRIFDKAYSDNVWLREAIEALIDAKVAAALATVPPGEI